MYDKKQCKSYGCFDDFIETFLINKKSYATTHTQELDLLNTLKNIKDKKFNLHLTEINKKEEEKIVLVNIMYFYSFAVSKSSISESKKREYITHWFNESISKKDIFFDDWENTIGLFGTGYTSNQYYEIIAITKLFIHLTNIINSKNNVTVDDIKEAIEELSQKAQQDNTKEDKDYYVCSRRCGIYNMLLHFSDFNKYEAILTYGDKDDIVEAFQDCLTAEEKKSDIDEKIKIIKESWQKELPSSYSKDSGMKNYKWYFYGDKIIEQWKPGKTSKAMQDMYNF